MSKCSELSWENVLLAVLFVSYRFQPAFLENSDAICVHVLQSGSRKVPETFWDCNLLCCSNVTLSNCYIPYTSYILYVCVCVYVFLHACLCGVLQCSGVAAPLSFVSNRKSLWTRTQGFPPKICCIFEADLIQKKKKKNTQKHLNKDSAAQYFAHYGNFSLI